MYPPWFRAFADDHPAMLWWLGAVAVTTVGATLVVCADFPDAILVLIAVPILVMAGSAAALAEIVLAFRRNRDDPRSFIVATAGTVALAIAGVPLTLALAATTASIADSAAMIRDVASYRQIVSDLQSGALRPSAVWQSRGATRFLAEGRPHLRIVFPVAAAGFRPNSIVYDPSGGVATSDQIGQNPENPEHRIGVATVRGCSATIVAAYYRCHMWGLDDD
ncbi:hypothetical protein QH494_07470 [Sphingomonas sp. AR_OL41]|uniref:hypothetical protein n=1 Tax=Sphingomonas sp. AR_OL41 TaxID=3042729 RepID=UPI00247FC446|nr:hypothetical protein [Sphingomonas sp. AR_OL41]MDH7972022.1 hypothetical protein [Sphingomonas sp. AR_OL41]